MKLIVGLGNPGVKYKNTRHNAGFLALDWLTEDLAPVDAKWQKKFDSKILYLKSSDYILAKPQTFMNTSGGAVRKIVDFYKIDASRDLLILHDDVDLPLGRLRIRAEASAAGHNGVQGIINALGSQNFSRIRIGIENRTDKKVPPTDAFVLQNFTPEELHKLKAETLPGIKAEIDKFLKAEY